jgi:hypothetical protein
MNFSLKHWLNIFGGALCLVAVAYVVMRFSEYSKQIDFTRFDATAWLLICLLAFMYAASNLFLAKAWWHLLIFFDTNVNQLLAVKIYGMSQLAKYVPGNIFHLAGRQALGMAHRWSPRALAKSSLWELGLLIIFGSLLFGLLAAPLAWPEISVFISTSVFLAMSAGGVFFLRSFSQSLGAAIMWQIIFLLVSSTVFMGVIAVVAPNAVTISVASSLCGAYVIAWVAGLITPGAPAGVGVREIVLLYLFGGHIQQIDLLLSIALGRLITVSGDIMFFVVSTIMKEKRCPQE